MEIGIIKNNNNNKEFEIISKNKEKSTNKHTYYNIKFIESGYEDCVRSDSINKGLVKDNLSETCCGIGKIGYINTRNHIQEYKIWENMIYRCYCKTDKSYQYYGGKGVTVSERWKRFDLFAEDIRKITGFDDVLFKNKKIKLDKDIIGSKIESKVYSLDTTMWVSDLENQKQRTNEYNIKNKKYVIHPNGEIELILHLSDFCKEHKLHRQNVYKCLSGKQSKTQGFKFYKE